MDDRARLRAIAGGDCGEFERLYRETKDDLWSLVSRMLGRQDEAEDVLQDVYLELVRRASRIELRGALRAYLIRACVNRVTDLRRRRRSHTDEVADLEGAEPEPAHASGANEQARRAHAALAALPVEQRDVVVLRVFGHCKFREIGEALSVSLGTAQSRYRYAMQSLRQRLAPQGTGERG